MDSDSNGGVATYWSTLLEEMARLDAPFEFRIYYPNRESSQRATGLPSNFQPRALWPASRWVEIPVSLPLEIARRPIDLLHVQSVAPPLCPSRFVLSIPDVAWVTHPEVFPPMLRRRMDWLVRFSVRRALRVLTISEFSKAQICKYFGLAEEKVVVAYLGARKIYKPVTEAAALEGVRRKYGITSPFILYVGKIQARKNLVRLVKAFHIIRQRGLPHQLVLVGQRTYLSADIFEAIEESGLTKDVIVPGEVPLADLPALYSAASLFAFPSLSEGFGIPPLEALCCGTPVVTSNTTSLPEVVGDAGIQVDPCDVHAIAQAMYDVLNSDELRRELIARGLRQSKRFSNRTMAERTLEVYEDALKRNRESHR